MVKIATIGTSMITEKFLTNAKDVDSVKVTGMYSRNLEKAKKLGEKFGIEKYYDDLSLLANDSDIDGVYIASPNSLHYEQTMMMLNAGKHVLCEKTMASNFRETRKMYDLAKEKGLVLLEGMRTLHDPAYRACIDNLEKIGTPRKACFEYCQYSSRYDLYQKGEVTNIFDPAFSAGALYDIGVYCVGVVVDIFGAPKETFSSTVLLSNGIDGCGTIHAGYEGFNAEISYSKITRSDNPSQIQGEKGTIYIDPLPKPSRVWIIYTDGKREDIPVKGVDWNMAYETAFFADAINGRVSTEHYDFVSLETARILEETRKQTGIVFPADSKETNL